MPKLLKSMLLFSFPLFFCSTFLFAAEELTITTYYPSPQGVYDTLRIYPNATFNPTAGVTPCTNEGELRYSDLSSLLFMCQKDPDAAMALRWRKIGDPGRNCQTMTGSGTYNFDSSQGTIWWNQPFTSVLINPGNMHTASLALDGTITADCSSCTLLSAKMEMRIQYMKTNIAGAEQWLLWRTLDSASVKATHGETETEDFGSTYTWPVDPAYRYKFRVQGKYPYLLGSGSGTIVVNTVEICFD